MTARSPLDHVVFAEGNSALQSARDVDRVALLLGE